MAQNNEEVSRLVSDVAVGYSEILPIANGSYHASGETTSATNRIRTDFIKIYAGSKITIENGTMQHACGVWACDSKSEISAQTNVRNDNSWITTDEEITFQYDGFIIIIFRVSTDVDISVDDFDGEITYTRNLALRKVNDLEYVVNQQISKNIIGNEANVMYPCIVEAGSTLTMSTADGLPIDISYLNLIFYDENGTDISGGGYNFTKTAAKRTITCNFLDGRTASYVKWSKSPERNVQVEFGSIATEYAEYFPNTRASISDIYKKLESSEDLIQKTFNSSVCSVSDFKAKCKEFTDFFSSNTAIEPPENGVEICESFLFFTDLHLLNGNYNEQTMNDYISTIQKYYNSTPTSFVICGGDWIGNADLPSDAAFKLGYIDGFMSAKFDNYYMLVGNHDTNYQGKADAESQTYTARLSPASIHNLWYRSKSRKTYYAFNGENTKFYCFDTGVEAQGFTAFSGYYFDEVKWFANSLLSDNSEHIALALHIFFRTATTWDTTNVDYIADMIFDIAKAYNDRDSITIDGTSYDYQSATGKVEFAISGHTHTDISGTYKGIPVLITCSVDGHIYGTAKPTFDLIFVDYDNRVLKTIRVGNNLSRVVSLD